MRTFLISLTFAAGLLTFLPSRAEIHSASEPLAAKYETSFTDRDGQTVQRGAWYIARNDARIETSSAGRGEIWQRSPGGRISLRRVFRDDSIVIEYTAAELAARGITPDWETLGSVVAPAALRQLQPVADDDGKDTAATLFRGKANGEDIEIRWLPEKNVPALVKRSGPQGTFTLRLVETRSTPAAEWRLSSHLPLSDFRTIDAADLGDLEHDAAVKRLLRQDPAQQPHAHSH
ncbi:MAG: hypothetical protein ACR2FI_03715 [Burkholderiales bacterium]|nr:hypothetical protein [Pseudomonadota bacterium]